MTPAPISVESWQLIDGQRSADGMTYTAVYWCENTGAIKTERTSDGRFRMGEGPRIRKPALLHQLAEIRDELASLQVIHNCLRRDHERSKARAEAAERAREEARGLLRSALAYMPPIDHQDPTRQRIAAFLAASGGSK